MPDLMDAPLSVKRLLEQIKARIEPPFAGVCVVGEVSGLRTSGKHWYFTLKEEGAALQCALAGALSEQGVPARFAQSVELTRVDAGSFELRAGATPEAIGTCIAHAMHESLAKGIPLGHQEP